MIAIHVIKQTVAHACRNYNHVSSPDDGFYTPRVVLASKTEPRTAGRDAQHLVSCTVEVRGVIHCIAPLRGDDANLADVRFNPVRGGVCRDKGGVVDDEGLGVEGRVGDEVVSWNLVFGDAELGEGREIGVGRVHCWL